MLQADKQALERELRVKMLNLQWKELEYLHTNFQNLATSSAILVGFGFSALTISTSYHPESSTPHSSIWELAADETYLSPIFVSEVAFSAIFACASSLALGFNLLSLFISTICSMTGPGMALRGPEGSVSLAVRHMEQQLKRALRFFGRGVIAFVVTLTSIGLRHLQNIGFLGGVLTVAVGLWVFQRIWHYGADIAEKFHVSPELAVRGTFVTGPGGHTYWQNTQAERAELTSGKKRWRPPDHGVTTPLWRLDKMISFPYHDEASRFRRVSEAGSSGSVLRDRAQLENLVLNAQGPVEMNQLRPRQQTAEGFDGMLSMMSNALVGGGADEAPMARRGGPRLLAGSQRG